MQMLNQLKTVEVYSNDKVESSNNALFTITSTQQLSTSQNELINICIAYRFISLTVSTILYLISIRGAITPIKLLVALGMIIASVLGAYLYKKSSDNSQISIITTVCIEVIAYGLFIFITGGFSSPYLWYSISSLTIVMANGKAILLTIASIAWCFICALVGYNYWPEQNWDIYSDINTGIGFLVVAGGFYTLFTYMRKLEQNRQELRQLNSNLEYEQQNAEQALQRTMDLYDTFNLFSITGPDKVMNELTELLRRTIAKNGCILLRVNRFCEIKNISSSGIPVEDEGEIIKHIASIDFVDAKVTEEEFIPEIEKKYKITYVSDLSSLIGIFVVPYKQTKEVHAYKEPEEQFYFNLIRVVLKELGSQEMVEEYIVSEEQNRIANEIHDTVIQKLFAIDCNLNLIRLQRKTMDEAELDAQLKNTSHAVESSMRELRDAIYGMKWENDGRDVFVIKLTNYIDEISKLSKADIRLEIPADTELMTVQQKTTLYRVICEAINNAIRHGKATLIKIRIGMNDLNWTCLIRDNGKGFTKNRLDGDGGNGLKNMYRMVNLLKGQLLVETKSGEGTTISFKIPR